MKGRVLLIAVLIIKYIGCSSISNNVRDTEERIHNCGSKAVKFLESAQMKDGAIRDPDNSIFNVWETVNATLAISLWSDITDLNAQKVIEKAIHFLTTSENPDGMVLHNKNHHGSFCLETSSEYVCLLIRVYSATEPAINEKLKFIKNQQLLSGCWKIVSPIIPSNLQKFPSVTGFALKALLKGGKMPKYYESAMKFLSNSQNKDGHWGMVWQFYNTPFYAMAPILWVFDKSEEEYPDILKKAQKYLIESQNDDGSWFYKPKDSSNAPSSELQTALALQSCFSCGLGPKSRVVKRGIHYLLEKQTLDGYWDGGYFPCLGKLIPKKEDIYATSQALIALHQYWILMEKISN